MGSATTQALAASVAVLDKQRIGAATARDLFAAARAVAGSPQLSGALADHSAGPEARTALVASVFGKLSAGARNVIAAAAAQRWSSRRDLIEGIEDLAVRAAAKAEKTADVAGELFGVTRLIASNPELELALGSTLGDPAAKSALIEKLLAGKASETTILIVSELVRELRGRRVRSLLSDVIRTVAAQTGRTVATVTTARPLTDDQAQRLTASLSRSYGGEIALNQIIDADVVGGIRVQIADDVIDGSISARLTDLRQKLAG
ncbi:F0F1 ATP synthase subunit delta [Microbacterium sediminis]|uniref:ATP synthase subunit delta n=1 Tax=Microbacterium sediminis TaxID=904291 RepID=A0A1B9NCJ7_9MICO|nr:F0F1 ATP synthase subunit delta [Microbacterium sediminis]OCG74303.1 ATP synthase F1 subunit delta [Microbacterium sediminis]QBR73667.1 F0F1 ATP synthase subunit delta [Microbacterium sediminis]